METLPQKQGEQAFLYIEPLNSFIVQVKKGTDVLNNITDVTTQDGLENATLTLNKAKTLSSLITKKAEELCKPLRDVKAEADKVQKQVKDYAKEISLPIIIASMKLEEKIIKYHKDVKAESDRVRRIFEESVREQNEMQKFANTGELPIAIIQNPSIDAPAIKGMTTIWKYEIEDVSIIPLEYMVPDHGKINAAVKSGCRMIPGVKIFEHQLIKKTQL